MLRDQVNKDDENIFYPTTTDSKNRNAYNMEGPKGSEVRKVIKCKEIS